MGTNYYAEIEPCSECGRGKERIHIGKSSAGWYFVVDISHEKYHDWSSFETFVNRDNIKITNEFGDIVSIDELMNTIFERGHTSGLKKRDTNRDEIHCEMVHGTYIDFCDWEFS